MTPESDRARVVEFAPAALYEDSRRAGASSRVVRPGAWVPSAYFAEGVPYAVATWAVGTMLKDLGHSDGEITVATACVGLAWSLKPLWAALLDAFRTKKFFVVATEVVMAALLVALGLSLRAAHYLPIVIAVLWMLAFASATQDICVDGVYITSLDDRRQSAWMGVQGVAWMVGRIFATTAIVWLAGRLEVAGLPRATAWEYALGASGAAMGALGLYHHFVLPTGTVARRPASEAPAIRPAFGARIGTGGAVGAVLAAFLGYLFTPVLGLAIGAGACASIVIGWREHVPPFLSLLRKKSIIGMLVFVLLYRTGEGFLLQEAPLFLQSAVERGGLGLGLQDKSLVDGLSTLASLGGGLLGGVVAARYGLRRVLLILALSMNVPHLCYIVLSQAVSPGAPLGLVTVGVLVSVEKLGYSFGFVGNMLYMMQQLAPGPYKMTHYAYATAFMQLVLIPTQAASGKLADWLGYRAFFIFVMVASLPSILAAWRAPFPNSEDVPNG
jgi:MFS transporter, PAT family, beta-lactamase induction signal transducer AmpG